MDIQTLRKVRPELANLDDETVVKAVALDYPDIPVEKIASDLGVKIAAPPGPPRTVGGTIGDFAISGLKGAIAVPEAAVGLADMATGGYAGKAAEGLGFRPAEARAMLDEHYSDPQKASFKAVNDAQGFGDTLQAAVTHPSTIAHSVVESLPLMGAGGVAGRGILALGERAVGAAAGGIGPTLPGALARAAFEANPAGGIAAAGNTAATIAGAAGEGISMAGQDAEQIRQANVNKDGLLTGEQTALAGAIGITGGGIALVGGMVAKKLGIHDVDTMLAAGQVNPIAGKGLVRSMLEGAFAEGVLEELPQSVVEQVLQNKAMGKPLDDGLDNAAVMGMLAGAVMGAGANAMGGHTHANVSDKRPGEPPAPGAGLAPVDPSAGPLSAAAATAAAAGPVSEPGSGEHLKEAVGALAKAAQDHEPSAQDQQDRELNLAQQNAPAFPAPEAQTAEEAKAERDQAVYDEATAGMPTKSPAELKAESAAIDEGAHQAATSPKNDLPEPTLAQKEAGNYQKGHINVQGLDISVENPQGSTRTGLRPDGTEWSHDMSNHYGYIKRTEGADGEHVDAYVGPAHDAPNVFVVDQVHQKPGFPFDEHKVMIGFNSRGAAVNAYKSNFDKGWMMGRVTEMPMDQFKDWLKSGDLKAPASPKGPLGTKGTTDATVEAAKPQATEATTTEGTGAAAQPGTAAATGAASNVEAPGLTLQQRRAAGKADIEHLFGLDTPEGKARAVKTAWQRGTPAARVKQLTAAGYTDGDQARVFSNTGWADLSQTVRDALGRDKAPAPGAVPQVVENKGNAEPRSGSNSQPESPHPELAKLVDRAETDFEYSPRDLFVDLPDLIADGKAPKSLSAAVDAYQNELDDDRDMGGRGDMDAADEALMAAVHAALKPEAAPVDVQKAMSGAVSTKHLTDKQVDQVAAMFDKKPAVSKNTIVTDEHAARARAILKSKLSTPMSTGLDPELMQAGITMALYHIERGARTFAAYSKAMIDDMGEAIRPYLKSWYMATKYDPRAAHFEMDDEAKINAPAEAANASTSEGGSSLEARHLVDSFYSQIVRGNIEVDGSMYTRQGASWPVRVIAIEGREKSDGVAPAEGTIPRAETWEQVYERYEQSVDASGQVVRGAAARPGGAGNEQAGAKPVSRPAVQPAASDGGRQPRGGKVRDGNVAGTGPGTVVDRGAVQPGGVGPATGGERGNGPAAASDRLDDAGKPAGAQARGQDRVPRAPRDGGLEPEDNQFQVTYVPRSVNKDEGVLIPVNMAQPLQEALDHLEAAVGDIDQFAQKELGFASVDEMHDALMGLQVDSIASAIHQIKSGKGVIIADQTGIGKGRQAAAIIRWAARNDKIPVFITMKPELFSDMHGDLADIGTHDIAPFVMNAGEPIVTREGERIFETTFGARRAAIAKMQASEMPEGRNAVFMTYSQINQERAQRGAVQGIAHRAVFILDESHNAGGESNTGGFIKEVLDLSQGVTYLSATYAKRPDNMPLYFKTDMGEAVADDDTLMSAMENGGLPLQTVVSNNLVKAGQMFRRERSYAGIDIKTVVDDKHRVEHEKLSDKTTTALRAIVNADMMFHEHFVKEMQKEMEKSGGRAIDNAGNQAKASVDHTQFSSVVHNFVRQMLLGLKAQDAADRAIARLKEGYKPIIALENTMGSFLNAYAADHAIHTGDSLGSFDYRTVLTRALERTRYITIQDRTGTKVKKHIPMSQITGATLQAYLNAQAVIDDLELDIPVSPIDWMRQQITNAGHTVAEITGRDLAVDYSNPLKPKLTQVDTQEQNDKVRTTRLYNSGDLDSLIINVSGSTGISLHSSEKFKDQRPRRMIVAQAAQDINILMQMLGRIHRTGQVNLPGYEMLTVDLPAERRPAALTSKKMKSLNANTSSNTESATSVEAVDMLNKYGDRVVAQYLDDNPTLRSALGLGFSNLVDPEGKTSEDMKDLARKATGRLALMPVAQQKAFYEDVESQYNALIEYLNKTNQNDLEPRTFDFDAKEVNSEKIFEGTNPASPFGSDANYGEYSVKSQGKPMTPEEISAEIKENLAGDLPAVHASKILQKLDPLFDKYAAPLQDEHRAAADAARARVKEFIQHHAIGDLFRVDINGDAYNAVVTNIRSTHKANGNPYSASKIQVSIAVNGGLRHLTLPATQFQNIEVSSMHKGYRLDSLFNVKAEGRETAKIITGNLLGAYGELQGVRGTIISFTKNDGTVEQGILLPKQFQMAENAKGGYRLRSGVDAVKFLHESNARDIAKLGIATRDGAVRITPNGDGVTIRVPKSKAAGAKYFLDKNIRAAAGDFASVGDRMVANVPASRAVAAIDAVMKKQAVYALPSHAETAKAMFGSKPAFNQSKVVPLRKSPADKLAAMGYTIEQGYEDEPAYIQHQDGTVYDWNDTAGRFEDDDGNPLPKVAAELAQYIGNIIDGLEKPEALGEASNDRQARIPGEDPSFRQTNTQPSNAKAVSELQAAADAITEQWARKVEVVVLPSVASQATPKEVRDEAKALILRGGNVPSGVWYDGRVYAFADRISSNDELGEVIAHEVKGHMGLRGNFGDELDGILRQIAQARPAQVSQMIRKNGFKEHERLRAAEEILAEMAQKEPTLGFVRRAVAAIKTFLRSIGINTKLSDDEIIRSYLMPAAKFVEEGTRTPAPGAGLRFQQAQRTVQVDGVRRPDTNSKGQLIHPAFQGQVNFWRWFGDSKVVDETGRPVVTFHGDKDAKEFGGIAQWFTADPAYASAYAGSDGFTQVEGGHVTPAYLAIANPMEVTPSDYWKAIRAPRGEASLVEKAKAAGHDGIIVRGFQDHLSPADMYVTFSPEQIKSAVGNNGQFDKMHANIMFSQYAGTNDPRQFLDYGIDALREYGATPGKVNWWHKTFGTMFDLAERNPVFKTVYDKVQTYLADISHYATEAADLAPRILPKIETWKDLAPKWAGGKKQALSVQEKTAIQAPIWEGNFLYTRDQDGRPMKIGEAETRYENLDVHERGKMLMSRGIISEADLKRWQNLPMASFEGAVNNRFDAEFMKPGIRWTDEELKSRYGLDDHTMGLYKEARESLDRSVTRLSLSTMLSVAGKDARTIADQVMDAKTPMEGAEMIRDYLLSVAEQDPARSEVLTGTANKAIDIGTQAKKILDRGYAPAMRFGHYAVDVVDRKTGEREFFRLYEGRMEARRAAEQLAQEYPNAEIRRGTTSDEAYKQFAGVSPETLELFGEMLGLDAGGSDASSQAFQTFLKETKSNRSAMRRLIERKGVPGYHEDISRVLAGFVYSNARQTSGNLHMGQIGEAVASVGRDEQGNLRDGELRDAAYRLMAYVKDPAQEAPGFRNLLFAQYLGGSVASALVNMTQPIQVTMPYLSQWGGVRAAAGVMRNALATAWKESTGNAELDHALKRAEEDGIVAPQETHQLQAYARGVGSLKSGDGTTAGNAMAAGSNAAAMIVHGWGKFFSSAELFNRRVTYVAAWNLAKQQGIKDADAFARKAVDSTQFVYNKGNRPEWARGAIGATLFTFKQYSISYMELMHRMYTQGGPEGKKAALFSLAMLMLMGGAGGLPFAEDAADVAEGIAQRFGYNLSVKQSRKELLNAVFGDVLGQFLDKGVSGIPGAPLDVSGRFGMGNLIPGTGLFVKKTDHTRDVAELAGPAGDFVTRLFQGANQAAAGKPVEGMLTAAPKAVSNLSKAVDMATSGMYKDAGGKKVIDTDAFDALTKAIGFQPNDVARSQEAAGIVQQRVAETRLRETEIADEWAKRAFAKDPDAAQWARAQVADWNEKNPDSPMRIQYQQILKRLREMNKTKAQRIEASSPKEMRASVRRELEGK